jgi:hypothetical protein
MSEMQAEEGVAGQLRSLIETLIACLDASLVRYNTTYRVTVVRRPGYNRADRNGKLAALPPDGHPARI